MATYCIRKSESQNLRSLAKIMQLLRRKTGILKESFNPIVNNINYSIALNLSGFPGGSL